MPATNRLPWVLLSVFVILAGMVVGGFFSLMAGVLYAPTFDSPSMVGSGVIGPAALGLGMLSGVGAAVFWLLVMQKMAHQRGPVGILLTGTLAGVLAGSLATAFLHLGLMLVSGRWSAWNFLMIPMFGAPAGFATGLFCSLLWCGAKAWAIHRAKTVAAADTAHSAARADQTDRGPQENG